MSTSSSLRKPKFSRGTEIAGWSVLRQIGSGGFGTVHEVVKDGVHAAMKTEFIDDESSEALRNEVFQLRVLQWSPHFCKLFVACRAMIEETPFNMMVMTLVGRSLSALRRLCPESKFSRDTAFRLGVQTLQALEDMHQVGIIHRDIKASNFAWSDERRVYLLDLGFCRRYIEMSEDGKMSHRKPRKTCHFLGTSKYASLNAHNRKEQSRRDDLWGWLYMFVEFCVGRLIWANDSDFRTALKKSTIGSSLLNNCPQEMYAVFDHIRKLEYESKPNYGMMRRQLNAFLTRRMVREEDPYDWEEGGAFCEEIKKKEKENKEKEAKSTKKTMEESSLLSSHLEKVSDALSMDTGDSGEKSSAFEMTSFETEDDTE